MRTSILSVLIVALLSIAAAASADTPSVDCGSLDSCLALMARSSAKGGAGNGIDEYDQELVDKVRSYGAVAIPGLLKLLEAPSRHVRERAAYALKDIDGLTAADLPALEKAVLAGNVWAPGDLKHIDTPESIQFLMGQLRSKPLQSESNTVGSTLTVMAPDSIPYLVGEMRCDASCSPPLLQAVSSILGSMKAKAATAVGPLTDIAVDTRRPTAARRAALAALEAIGPTAAAAAPAVFKITQGTDTGLKEAANQALVSMGSPAVVPQLLKQLQESAEADRPKVLMQFYWLGNAAADAGPAVLHYLGDADWDTRVAAAAALGSIGYAPAADSLMRSLQTRDWRLTYAAAHSLGKLHVKDARSALQDLQAHHWSRAVRQAAADALAAMDAGMPMAADFDDSALFETGAWEQLDVGECKSKTVRWKGTAVQMETVTANSPSGQNGTAQFTLPGNTRGYFKVDNTVYGLFLYDPSGEHRERVKGFAVGEDGEDIVGVFRLGDAIVAAGGLRSRMFHSGRIYTLARSSDGSWHADSLAELPGAPLGETAALDAHTLAVDTEGGAVWVKDDGQIGTLDCSE